VYYAGDAGILQDGSRSRQSLTFVTRGALLGIKLVGTHRKHVVALNADAVKNRAGDGLELRGTFWSGGTGFGAKGLGTHGPIVA
jgi:hypothetical protein